LHIGLPILVDNLVWEKLDISLDFLIIKPATTSSPPPTIHTVIIHMRECHAVVGAGSIFPNMVVGFRVSRHMQNGPCQNSSPIQKGAMTLLAG
jgi:hypothetical protein